MNKFFNLKLALALAVVMVSPLLFADGNAAKPAEPYRNPHLAESSYSVTHMKSDYSALPGPTGPGRRLSADETVWKKIGPMNNTAAMYSAPYPNGKRVMWVGGYDRIAKLDADTLEVLTTYAIGGNTFFGEEEIERHMQTMDSLGDQALVDYSLELFEEPWRTVASFYRFLTRDNELYIPHRNDKGEVSIRVYAEKDHSDPYSKIYLKKEWAVPKEISGAFALMGLNMTPDGWVVTATMDGAVIALSPDFSTYKVVNLPSNQEESADKPVNKDIFASFLRNGLVVDDQGGIYIVTRYNMHRVQWTGSELSLNEADGAWTVAYPDEVGIGSGTTPGLMGWGPDEDHLVVITDAKRSNNMLAIWRDKIPEDWQGIPGYDRRVAGVAPIHFGVSADEQVQIENAPVIYGYGVFFNNTFPVKRLEVEGGVGRRWMAESFYMHVPGHEARGGAMISWDPQTRTLKQQWNTQDNLVSAVCNVSGATEILYCWGAREREWTLEGIDWRTGKSAFTYILGKSHRFNPMGGPLIVGPDGAIDCMCVGGLGIVRVKPAVQGTNLFMQ